MILRNYTPFSPIFFESRDVQGRDFGVLALRGTFDIVPGGALRPSPKQPPIVEADVWHGEPNASSLRMESDLAPFKPRTDICFDAVAHAPGGRPLPDWNVRVQVGAVRKELRVTGPRAWVREGGEWKLNDPQLVSEVPLRYERAFGGAWKTSWGETHLFEENPIGVGFVEGEVPWGTDEIPAPQIESPDDPVVEWGKRYRPEGLGPIARSWQPRLRKAGTADDDWQRTRWPQLPLDFEYSFYNTAHPDLIAPGFLRGDEEVELEGLWPEGVLRFWLPGRGVGVLVEHSAGSKLCRAPLDSMNVHLEALQVQLVWRVSPPLDGPARAIEIYTAGVAHGIQ